MTCIIKMSVSLCYVGGGDYSSSLSKGINLHLFDRVVDVTERNLPQVDPMDIIGRIFFLLHHVYGLVHRAEVMRQVDMVDEKREQYLVCLGYGMRTDGMTYYAIVNCIKDQLAR